jgi:uncharacterized protein with PIN domain
MSYLNKEALLEKAREYMRDDAFGGVRLFMEIENTAGADVVEVRHGENISEMHPVDEFICSECGLIVRDCCRYEIDEDADGDENCFEFEFKYCPRCGVKIVD